MKMLLFLIPLVLLNFFCAHSNHNRIPAATDSLYFGTCDTSYMNTERAHSNDLSQNYLEQEKTRIESQVGLTAVAVTQTACQVVVNGKTVTGRAPVVTFDRNLGLQSVRRSRCITPSTTNGHENDLSTEYVRRTALEMVDGSEMVFFTQEYCEMGRRVVVVSQWKTDDDSQGTTNTP